MTVGKTVPELTAETPPIVGTDEVVVYRSPGPLKRATAAAVRTYMQSNLGTMATQNANAVAITGGSITGITDLAVADGGTGAGTADGALTNLGGTTVGKAVFTAANAAAARTATGTVIGTDVQAYDADLAAIAALTSAADKMPYATGAQTWAMTDLTAAGRALLDDADATAQRTTLAVVGTADLAASTGAALVGAIQSGTGATARTVQSKLRDFVSVKDFGAVGDGSTNDTAAFTLALAYVETLPRGGEIYFPPGRYVADLNMRTLTSDFEKRITLTGAGRGATQILPTATGAIMLNMLGRNVTTVRDMTFYSGDSFAAACGIYMARSTLSGDCNNNKFDNVEVVGNFSAHAVVQCGAESASWINCRIAPNNGTAVADSGFWIGTNPALCGVTPPAGTTISGPCTDNRMIACETYIPHDGALHVTCSTGAGWVFIGHAFIGGTHNDQRFVTYTDPSSGVWNGSAQFIGCHYEVFGTNNIGHYIDNADNSSDEWAGIVSIQGQCVADNNFVFLDFNRDNVVSGGPLLTQCTFDMPALPPGITNGCPLYIYNIVDSNIRWHGRSENGLVVIFGFAVRTPIDATETRIAQLNNCAVTQWADARPTTGTYARGQRINRSYGGTSLASGDLVDWICSVSGTYGSLSTTANTTTGSNVITVASATGLKIGQKLFFGSQTGYVAKISGTTITMTANALATGASESVGFTPGGSAEPYFNPIGIVNIARAAAVTDPTGGATIDAEARTKIGAIIDALQAANLMVP